MCSVKSYFHTAGLYTKLGLLKFTEIYHFLVGQLCSDTIINASWDLLCHDDVIKWKHFRVTDPLCGEFTGQRWIPRTKASDAKLWCFLSSVLNKRLSKQSWGWWFGTPSRPLWRHCNVYFIKHSAIHQYSTGQSDLYLLPNYKNDIGRRSISFLVVKIWEANILAMLDFD